MAKMRWPATQRDQVQAAGRSAPWPRPMLANGRWSAKFAASLAARGGQQRRRAIGRPARREAPKVRLRTTRQERDRTPSRPSISPTQRAWIESSHGQLRVTIPSKRVRQGARWRLRTLRPAMPVSLGFDGDRERDQSLPRWRTCSSPPFPGLRGFGRDAARRRRMLRRHPLGGAARPRVDPMRPGYRCRPRVGTTLVGGQMARHSHPSS